MKKKLVKSAKQQFEEKLQEFGLLERWKKEGEDKIADFVWDNDSIVIFSYEAENDRYKVEFYPPFEELRKDDKFVAECVREFCDHCDKKFVVELCLWLRFGGHCPLFPLDIYYPASHLILEDSHYFEDIYE